MRVAATRRLGRRRIDGSKWTAILLFLPPALLLFTVFVVLPAGEAGWYSAFNWNGFGRPTKWIGLDNYRFILDNRAFPIAIVNTMLVIAVSLLVQLPLALTLAVLLAERFRGAVALRMLFFLPYILAEIAAGMIFSFIYDGNYGLLAAIYGWFGAEAPHVLADTTTAMPAILVVIVWKYFGFHMMLFVAALQGMDRGVIEAARIDGATGWQLQRHVVLPLLAPTIRLSVFFAVLGALQLFDLIMPLTRGGPADSSQTIVSFLYTFGVTRMRVGFGSAVGVILFLVCAIFAFTYKRWMMRDE
jgi:raffinose/stachyose/melibiose transport system permease protein